MLQEKSDVERHLDFQRDLANRADHRRVMAEHKLKKLQNAAEFLLEHYDSHGRIKGSLAITTLRKAVEESKG